MVHLEPRLRAVFYRSSSGKEPVRDWLKSQNKDVRRGIGSDVRLVQFAWPVGMPLLRSLRPELWELRSRLPAGRAARVIFLIDGNLMVLLHAFYKKTQKTPKNDLRVARRRAARWHAGGAAQ